MTSTHALNPSDTEGPCVVCFKDVQIYSIGVCDHPVCYDCSTRMRVLCKQKECPICRGDMPRVIFTKETLPYAELIKKVEHTHLQDVMFGMYFCSPSIQKAYYRLLEFNCMVCPVNDRRCSFRNFNQLRDHMRKEHELFYCDLCVDNLKIFSFERRCYTRSELAQHRRKGDTDNTSHRGHPLCEFCDQRYMDSDELFRHLRRDHLYCHFCDADGKHQYYRTYDDLRMHFLEDHYLCEEGDCKNEQFTSVFRSDIDLKAHVASVHSKHLSRAATKQARTLEVEFNFAPRRNEHLRQRGGQWQHRNNNNDEPNEGATGYENYNTEPGGPTTQMFVNPLRDANFPSLNHTAADTTPSVNAGSSRASVTFTSKFTPKFSGDEFPSLGGASVAKQNITITNQKVKKADDFPNLGAASRNITITKTTASAAGAGSSAANLLKNKQNFPALKGDGTKHPTASSFLKFTLNQDRPQSSSGPNVSIQVNHKPNGVTTRISTTPTNTLQVRPKSVEAFPALGPSTVAVAPVQKWVQPKPKKQIDSRILKTAPPPVLPPSSLSDFPKLSRKEEPKTKKTSSVTMPMGGTVWSDNSDSKPNKPDSSKKDKNKKNKVETKPIETPNKNKKKKNKNADNQSATTSIESIPPKQQNLNGIVKKTSTLKIGNLENTNGSSLDDFPALNNYQPPPPGITVKPPPGFNFLPKNDLTFTTSSGQSYSILPTHTYCQPPNFNNRNSSLVQSFFTVLKTSEAMIEFKNYSDLFRQGSYPAERYYTHCECVLKDSFEKIFPELLVLLPNIERQQDLFKIYKLHIKVKDLQECATCKQIIYIRELKQHHNNHFMENHFPTLGQSVETNTVWKK